jgi:N-acetylneuraminic acid mutarotase
MMAFVNQPSYSGKRFFGLALLAILSVFTLNHLTAQQSDQVSSWKRVASMPIGVFFACGSQADRKYIVTGGVTSSGQTTDAIQTLDLDTGKWRVVTTLPVDRFEHAQVTLPNGHILIAGGRRGNVTDLGHMRPLVDAMIFDPQTNQITTLPDLLDESLGPSATRLDNGCAVVIAGQVAHVLKPDGTGWQRIIDLQTHRFNHAAVAVSRDQLLLIGGTGRNTLELVDTRLGTSQFLACHLPQPTDDLAATRLPDGTIWITGGQDTITGNTLKQTWLLKLNPYSANATLTPGPELDIPNGVADHRVVQRNGRIIGMGGESQLNRSDTELNQVWELDTQHRMFKHLPSLNEPHDDSLLVYDQNRLWVIGGYQKKDVLFGILTIPAATDTVERMEWK